MNYALDEAPGADEDNQLRACYKLSFSVSFGTIITSAKSRRPEHKQHLIMSKDKENYEELALTKARELRILLDTGCDIKYLILIRLSSALHSPR
jgi:hypothetical protein